MLWLLWMVNRVLLGNCCSGVEFRVMLFVLVVSVLWKCVMGLSDVVLSM